MLLNKESNSQWPSVLVLETINLTFIKALALGVSKEVALKVNARIIIMDCSHWMIETEGLEDNQKFIRHAGTTMKCRHCFHVKLLRDSLIKVTEKNEISTEGPKEG